MRHILFRGKRIDNGKWVYGDLIQYSETEYKILVPFFRQWDILEGGYNVIPETVSQFTGLLDKNGVLIFEGDRVIIDSELFMCSEHGFEGVVTYNECAFYVESGTNGHNLWSDSYQIEVIGNIHDK